MFCPDARFFSQIIIYFYFFYSQLIKKKSGKVGGKPANPHKHWVFLWPFLFLKWAESGQLAIFSVKITQKIEDFFFKSGRSPTKSDQKPVFPPQKWAGNHPNPIHTYKQNTRLPRV